MTPPPQAVFGRGGRRRVTEEARRVVSPVAPAAFVLALSAAAVGAEGPAPPTPAPELGGARLLHEESARPSDADEELLRRARREAARLRSALAEVRAASRTLLGRLQRVDQRLALARSEAIAAALVAEAAETDARAAHERADALDVRFRGARRRAALVVRALAASAPPAAWWPVLTLVDEDRAAGELAVVVARRQAVLARELEQLGHAAREAAEEARRRLDAAGRRRAEALSASARLERARERRAAEAERLGREEEALGVELAAAEDDLARFVGAAGARRRSPGPLAPAFDDPRQRRGRLPWPVARRAGVRLVERFGPVVHPRYLTRWSRNGLVLEAPEGEPVRAVASGRVVFADWYKGFGRAVVVDHGHSVLTVYGHLGEVDVREGDTVRSGREIGRVGASGSTRGPRLYFQLQRSGVPEDPEEWLVPRGP